MSRASWCRVFFPFSVGSNSAERRTVSSHLLTTSLPVLVLCFIGSITFWCVVADYCFGFFGVLRILTSGVAGFPHLLGEFTDYHHTLSGRVSLEKFEAFHFSNPSIKQVTAMDLVPVPKQRPNRLQRVRCFQPEEEEVQSSAIIHREVKREEEGRAEADALFNGDLKLRFTGGNVGFQVFVKGNHLLAQASVVTAFNDILNNPKRRLPVLRWEFDGSSKNLLGRHEGTRAVHRGSKILLFDVSVSFLNAMADDQVSSVPVFTHACKYPGAKHAVPNGVDGNPLVGTLPEFPRQLAESFEVADHVVRTMWPLISTWGSVNCSIIQLLSDSGGSTLNSQLYIMRIVYRYTDVSKVILWCGRCRVHQGAISGRESCELFMRLAGLNPVKTQKRIYLASMATKVKTQNIQDGVTKILNERLVPTDDHVNLHPGQHKLLKSLRVSADVLVDFTAMDDVVSNSEIRVRRSHYQQVRKSIMRQFKSIKLPVWSRWLTYGDACKRLTLMMFFFLSEVCSKMFGTSVKLRGDEEEENVFHESSMHQNENQTVWKVTYFTNHILAAIDKLVGHQLRSRDTGERISGRELVQAFGGWIDTSLKRLRDTATSTLELELILHRKLTPEDKMEATKLSALASLSVIASLCNVEFRYGSHRDRHEAWVDSYLGGRESSTSLLGMEISEEDGGDISLKSLQRYIGSLQPKDREPVLSDIVKRLAGLDVHTKLVEEKIGRFKRASKHDRSHRGVVAADTVSNRAEWHAASKKPQLEKAKSEIPDQSAAPRAPRYCIPRGVDVARSSKMRAANSAAGVGQLIGKSVNSWESGKAKSEGRIQSLVSEMHKENKTQSAEKDSPANGNCDLEEREQEGEKDLVKTRHHIAVQHEQNYYEKVEATVRTWWSNENLHKAACNREVEVSCNRIHRQLTFEPFGVTVRGRPVSPAEIAVCSAVRFERKRQKAEESVEGTLDASVDDVVPMMLEEEADNPNEEEDILEGVFCRQLYILSFREQSSSSSSVSDAGGNADADFHRFLKTTWLVLRTDLCANDFSAVELIPRQVSGESVYCLAAGNRRLHSPSHDVLLKAGGQYELHQSSVLFPTPGEDGVLPEEILIRQGDVVVFKRSPKKERTRGPKLISPENVGQETAYERDSRRGFLVQPAKRMKVDETVARLVREETKNSMALVKSRIAFEGVVEGNVETNKQEYSKGSDAKASGGKAPAPAPRIPKVPKYDLSDDTKLDLYAYRRQVTADLFRYAPSGFKCVEGSSTNTYKELGVLGNRIRMDVEDPRYTLVFLKLVQGEWGIDLKTRAKANPSRYFAYSFNLGYESAARVAALWALRTRFIIRRSSDYMKEGLYENNSEKGLEAEWQQALAQLPEHVSGDWQKTLTGNDLATYRDLVILCPMAKSRLKILGTGRDGEVGPADFCEFPEK